MDEHIIAIRNGIKTGRFVNEAAISHGVVLRILHALGWPIYDTDIVAPEYSLAGRRVDYALCHPRGKPVAFVEAKHPGQSSEGDRQLFEYAFHQGVPMAILTDGQEWHFFLPAEQGDYGERRVYKLDILERQPAESIDRLKRYLDFRAVSSGEALEAARRDYRDVAKEREIQATLPEAWTKLVDDADDLLLELVADKVESLCGYKPEPDMVATFLADRLRLTTSSSQLVSVPLNSAVVRQPRTALQPPSQDLPASIGFTLEERVHRARNARDVLVKVLQALADRDPSFLERFAALPKHGRTRRYVGRSREELYPGRPDLARDHAIELRPGWWVGVNLSRPAIERVIEMACQVADLRYGIDVRVHLG